MDEPCCRPNNVHTYPVRSGNHNCSFFQCRRDPHPIYEGRPTVGYQGHIPYLIRQNGVSYRQGVCNAIREFDCQVQKAHCCLPYRQVKRSCCSHIGEDTWNKNEHIYK